MREFASIPGTCDVHHVRGARSTGGIDLLLEVPHGATRARDFAQLREQLCGTFPADLQDFFFVNTDVGAPEVALAVAERFVAADPSRSALVVRCLVPRTFVDCNRMIDGATLARASAAGEMTPGLHAWVQDPRDRSLLLRHHGAYRELAEAAFDAACGSGGLALMVHSYAPRSIDVPVDERIVERLRAEYEPGRLEAWPERAPVDLILDEADAAPTASAALAAAVEHAYRAAGLHVARNGSYALHPVTTAFHFSARHPQRTLCLELRRDLLVHAFTPFAEMGVDPARVERMAAPLARAVLDAFAARR